jgi:Fe-S-cluster-containing dehydrogenase component
VLRGGGVVVLAVVAGVPLAVRGEAPTRTFLLFDPRRCQGCATCAMACSTAHHGVSSPSLARIQVWLDPFAAYPDDLSLAPCRQCEQPACVEACPTGANHVDDDNLGVRRVDTTRCVACGMCVESCPHSPGRMGWDAAQGVATKCDLCTQAPFWNAARDPDGRPACVALCPMGALTTGHELPPQDRADGHEVDLRGKTWQTLGYDPR